MSEDYKPKRHLSVKVNMPPVDSLRKLSSLLDFNPDLRLAFDTRYGKILSLLDINVQADALTALLQFYDPPLRCFTFQDFQLAPTLEEFGQILGYPIENDNPYCYSGTYPHILEIAEILRVDKETLERKKPKGLTSSSGFIRSFFEKRAHVFAKAGDWDAFMDLLALILFGVILFPTASEEIISLSAIDAFLAFKNRGENPTHAVLADAYYTFNYCHEKKGNRILCCFSVLYVWLVNHMYDSSCQTPCPIAHFQNSNVGENTRQGWAERLVNLNENTVQWYPRWWKIGEVICQCGNYPNVPLIGTRGCINYNPVLALRQLGYPIVEEPEPSMLTPLIVYDMGLEDIEIVRTIRQSWKKVIRKGKELLSSCGTNNTYQPWVKKRLQEVKLPFHNLLKAVEETPTQSATMLKFEQENKSFEEELSGTRGYERKTILLETATKRAKVEKRCTGQD